MGLISAWVRQSSVTSNTVGMRYFWGADHCTKIFCYIYADCTFPVQREEINVVKTRGFTMMYSSRKLSHEKVIARASNFWRQIACSFQVKSGNVLLLGKKVFEIPPFFQTRPRDLDKKVYACLLRASSLKLNTGSKISVQTVLNKRNTNPDHNLSPGKG